jgi:transcriptional regulator with XRE-family HTH domain
MTDCITTIINKLINLRIEQGLSQLEIANRMQTSQSHVWRIEARKIHPRWKDIAKYADALGFTADVNFMVKS